MKTKKVNILQLSTFVLLYCTKNDISINHFKLQKILYYIQAWHVTYFNKENIFDDLPEAWVNGPVYRKVFNQMKIFKANDAITFKKDILANIDEYYNETKKLLSLTNDQWEFISSILGHYALMTHEKLIFLTHKESPWSEARRGLNAFEYSDKHLSIESMFTYYSSILDKNGDKSV